MNLGLSIECSMDYHDSVLSFSEILVSIKSISFFFLYLFDGYTMFISCSIFSLSPPFSLVNWKQILWGTSHFKTVHCFWDKWSGLYSQWNLQHTSGSAMQSYNEGYLHKKRQISLRRMGRKLDGTRVVWIISSQR